MPRRWFGLLGCLLAAGLASILLSPALAQEAPLPAPRRLDSDKDRVSAGPDLLPPNYGGGLPPAVPLSLGDALKLASLANLDIVQANLVIERARAALLRSRAQFLPDTNLGTQLIHHEGQLQNTAGNVQTINRDSLFNYLGPSMTLDFASALFGPDEARKLLDSARFGQLRVTNDTLQAVADAYFTLLLARRRLALYDEVLDFLTSEQESPLRGDSKGLLPLIAINVKAHMALPSDQARVEADVVRRADSRIRALQDVRVAAAELARLLHLSALVFLMPGDDYRWPLAIPGAAWLQQPIDEMVGLALRSRPELAENNALVQAAVARFRAAKWRPFLPTVGMSYSYGGYGGGPAIVGKTSSGANIMGESGTFDNYGSRADLQLTVLWRLQNLGVGNRAEINDTRAALDQQQVRQMQIQDQVMAQVVQAYEQVLRSKQRVDYQRVGLFDEKGQPTGAVYRSIRLNFIRIKRGGGLAPASPLEALDSLRRLSDILETYASALTDYDRSRFHVLTALGMSPGAILDPRLMPQPPLPPPVKAPAWPAKPPEPVAQAAPATEIVSRAAAPTVVDPVVQTAASVPAGPPANPVAAPVVQPQGTVAETPPGSGGSVSPTMGGVAAPVTSGSFTPTALPARPWRGTPGSLIGAE